MFLIILKLRNRKTSSLNEYNEDLDTSVVKKLVELQVYLEKGVRPLEGRLKYQIDKVLQAADDAKRAEDVPKPRPGKVTAHSDEEDEEDEDESEDDSDADSANGAALKANDIDDLQYRPNPSAFVRPADAADTRTKGELEDGVYKPPRIQATAMPTTGPRDRTEKKPMKSATLDEFVNTELSSAPFAEPSIGATTVSGGRRRKSEREMNEEAERREYEERNYVRLPKESKKERAKRNRNGGRDAGYGGEEWRDLGDGLDRIDKLTKRKGGEGRGNALEKSRKRAATEDGPRGSGSAVAEVGQGFQKRLKTLDGKRRVRGRQ